MKKYIYTKITLLLAIALGFTVSCERDLSEDVVLAEFGTSGDVFIDDFIGMGTNFYFPFVQDGAKGDVFSIDTNEAHESNSSIRIDVPDANDPDGGFAGFSFVVDGAGRNLTQYDALTFWAKSSQSANIGVVGFGESKYLTLRSNISFTNNWNKFIVPIPNASKLIEEKGMFLISAGGIGDVPGEEKGYTFWIDDLKFEKLGTIAQAQPSILNGEDVTAPTFIGGTVQITNFTQTFNLSSGENTTSTVQPSYFDFHSTNPEVATVDFAEDANGTIQAVVLTHSKGTAVLTGSINGVEAKGSLTVEVATSFDFAPTPTENAADVISVFSDAYTNVAASLISDFGDFQNSTLNAFEVAGDNILEYNNVNFFGIEFNGDIPTIDASDKTTLHVDVFVLGELASGSVFTLELRNIGPNNIIETNEFTGAPTGDDTQVTNSPTLTSGQWVSVDFNITGLTDRSALGQIVVVANAIGPKSFYLDNIYFY